MQQRDRYHMSNRWQWAIRCLGWQGVKHAWRMGRQTGPIGCAEVSGRGKYLIVTDVDGWVEGKRRQIVSHGIRVATQDFWKVPYLLRGLCEVSAVEVEREGSKRFENGVSAMGGRANVSRVACSMS